MKIAVTAHRPDKLYGYEMTDPRYMFLMVKIKQYLRGMKCCEAITGMALGGDLIFAQAVLELKKEGIPIKLTCAVPCMDHKKKWTNSRWIDKYDEVLSVADERIMVCKRPYDNFVMQERNMWMVDRCDRVLAIYNGSPGGTKNCLQYACETGKACDILNPYTLKFN